MLCSAVLDECHGQSSNLKWTNVQRQRFESGREGSGGRGGNTAGVGANKKQEGSLATDSLMSKDYHDDDDDDYVEMV